PAGLNGSNGFRILGGREGQGLGHSVSSAGDVNNDGFDDLLIGTRATSLGQSAEPGEAFVIFGKASAFDPVTSIYAFNRGEGFRIADPNPSIPGQLGRSVSNIGDFNGDGFDDFAVGEAKAGNPGTAGAENGAVHVILGGPTGGFPLSGLPSDFARTISYFGPLEDAGFGTSVSGIGDVNGDGLDDFIAVAPGAPFRTPAEMFAVVIYGDDTVPPSGNFAQDLSQMPQNGSAGFIVRNLSDPGANAANAGDVNGVGLDDFIIGGPNAFGGRGLAYVVYGDRNAAFNLDPATLDGSNGFLIRGNQPGGFFGGSVHAAGDVNNDGFDDVIIGAGAANRSPGTSATGDSIGGAAYVVFGGRSNPAQINVGSLDGTNGFVVEGISPFSVRPNDAVGTAVTGDVDVNGDGIDDVIIGAPDADSAPGSVNTVMAGRTYVIFGKDTDANPGVTLNGTNGADTLRGTARDDVIAGRGGADRIDGRGGNDRLQGDGGADILNGAGGADSLNGGGGRDTLNGGGGRDVISGGGRNDRLNGNGGNDRLEGDAGADVLAGGQGDDRLAGGGGGDTLIGGRGGDTMTGNAGADVFRFLIGDSGTVAARRDLIPDFSRGQNDRIDLRGIDGDPGRNGNQALDWIGRDTGFSEAGQVRFVTATNMVEINLDGDRQAEMRIELEDVTLFGGVDLLL
ncbi:MAG: hypothetical protein AB3N11_06295, partial [Arenibacterium sp.]